MNTIRRLILVQGLVASFAFAAIPGHAADQNSLVEVCATTSNGMVPKERVAKALNRMLDMGDTPEAAKMAKDKRRKMQQEAFWKEFARESGG